MPVLDACVKRALLPLAFVALCLCSCTTLQNRRDLYSEQKVDGPYTRMLRERRGKPLYQEPTASVTAPVVNPSSVSDGKSVKPIEGDVL